MGLMDPNDRDDYWVPDPPDPAAEAEARRDQAHENGLDDE